MEQWSAEHLAAIAATVALAAVATAGARRFGERFATPLRRGLAVGILAGFACEQLTYALRGLWSAQVNLPLQLSDAVTIVSIAALWHPEIALLVELVYFWALSASVQAVLTPDLQQSFPDVLYFTYFATHSGAIVAACLLVFGARRVPRPGAAWRAYAITAVLAAVAALATVVTDGNYMFLRRKPVGGSLLDVMGPWAGYIVSGALLGLALFLALDALARAVARPPARRPRPSSRAA